MVHGKMITCRGFSVCILLAALEEKTRSQVMPLGTVLSKQSIRSKSSAKFS